MPLLWLGVSFIIGIFLAAGIPHLAMIWLYIFFASIILLITELLFIKPEEHLLRSAPIFKTPFSLLLMAASLGGLCFRSAIPNFSAGDLAFYQPAEKVVARGVIISYPEISASASTAIVKADELMFSGETRPVHGRLELRLPPGFHLAYGDEVLLSGDLESAVSDNEPLQTNRLARQHVYSRMYYPQIELLDTGKGGPVMDLIYRIRSRTYDFIQQNLPAPESSLLSGILLGIDWTIPRYLEDGYRATGTIHIIAISGFNITLIAWQIIHLFRKVFRPTPAVILAIIGIIFYTIMVGADPAVVRAAIMGSLAIPAYFIGRRIIGINSLTIAAAVMLAINPFLLWDIGFQLSFLATLGLMVLADPLIGAATTLIERKWGEAKANRLQPLLLLVIPTLTAQFAVSPVLFNLDGAIHLYALPANLIILPLQPLLMTLGGIGAITGWVMPQLGRLFLMLSQPLARFCNLAALRFGLMPGAEISAPSSSSTMTLVLVTMTLLTACIFQIRKIGKPEAEANQG